MVKTTTVSAKNLQRFSALSRLYLKESQSIPHRRLVCELHSYPLMEVRTWLRIIHFQGIYSEVPLHTATLLRLPRYF
jgi:hypothetical protein